MSRIHRSARVVLSMLACLVVSVHAGAGTPGRFSGTAGGVAFDVDGTCERPAGMGLTENPLTFESDELGSADSNGDGVVVQVNHIMGGWSMRLVKDGEVVYNGAPGDFTAAGDAWRLEKRLTRKQQGDSIAVDVRLHCD